MLKAYKEYKNWWVTNQSHNYGGRDQWGRTMWGEEAFEHYWNNLDPYSMFEALLDWKENMEVPEGN